MNKTVKFTVLGTPVAKGRPRLGKWGTYTPEKTVNYENLVKLTYLQEVGQVKLEGALSAEVKAYFPVPKSTSKKKREQMLNGEIKHTKKPDTDNLIKSVFDSLNSVAFDDDSAICVVHAYKGYSDTPRVEIEIKEIGD